MLFIKCTTMTSRSNIRMMTYLLTYCGGAPSVPTVLSRLDRHVTYYPHICCTYVDTRYSLPSLKYTVVARLLTCLHLSTVDQLFSDYRTFTVVRKLPLSYICPKISMYMPMVCFLVLYYRNIKGASIFGHTSQS